MAEDRPVTSGRKSSGTSYVLKWNRFAASDQAAYLDNREEAGARAPTIKVAATATSHNHKEAGFDVSLRRGVARTILEDLTQDDSPSSDRALPLDLDCHLAMRKTPYDPRSGRDGRLERATNARRRGMLDVAMIALMRDARGRVKGGEKQVLNESSDRLASKLASRIPSIRSGMCYRSAHRIALALDFQQI